MKLGYYCGCPDCQGSHPEVFATVGTSTGNATSALPVRERLSEEEIRRIEWKLVRQLNLAAILEIGEIISERVTAARLAATGAAYEVAAQKVIDDVNDLILGDHMITGTELARRIMQLSEPDAVSALDEVRRKAREEGRKNAREAFGTALQKAESEAQRLREALEAMMHDTLFDNAVTEKELFSVGRRAMEKVSKALSAPAVSDGAAKGDGDGNRE